MLEAKWCMISGLETTPDSCHTNPTVGASGGWRNGNYSQKRRSGSGPDQQAINARTEEVIAPPRHREHREGDWDDFCFGATYG